MVGIRHAELQRDEALHSVSGIRGAMAPVRLKGLQRTSVRSALHVWTVPARSAGELRYNMLSKDARAAESHFLPHQLQ